MPRFDGTGPTGQGPMTGRGFGPCAGCGDKSVRSWGRGFGRGFGFRRWMSPTNNLQDLQYEAEILEDEINSLKAEKEALAREIKAVQKQSEQE